MKTSRRGAGLLLGLSSALTFSLLGASPASASTSTWTLEAEGQVRCVRGGFSWTYALSPVSGSWSKPITTGIRNLPGKSSANLGRQIIPPGTNERDPADGSLPVNGYVFFSLGLAPVGEYTAEIYATDGERTETDQLKIVYQDEYCQ
ncbi:DUF5980 family protein [Streptomyces sp. NPDC018964]|uniref:DUF5980 family protein n=1 Tax=unclassified Streptomyces TaxID=2593676 RepID=UPI001C231F15|nr:DUF5980 family protein [Streptomyces sp. AC558_RSS880]